MIDRERVARWQGGFFLASGVWPLVLLRSFEAGTGRKAESWLVKTIGLLMAVIGLGLFGAARQRPRQPRIASRWRGHRNRSGRDRGDLCGSPPHLAHFPARRGRRSAIAVAWLGAGRPARG